MADTSEPKSNIVAISGFLAGLFLFLTIVVAIYLLPFVIRNEVRLKIEEAPTISLDNLRNEEIQKLTQPAYVDRAAGIVRIPITRAMELEAQRPWRQDLPVPANTFPTTATAAGTPGAGPSAGGNEP